MITPFRIWITLSALCKGGFLLLINQSLSVFVFALSLIFESDPTKLLLKVWRPFAGINKSASTDFMEAFLLCWLTAAGFC